MFQTASVDSSTRVNASTPRSSMSQSSHLAQVAKGLFTLIATSCSYWFYRSGGAELQAAPLSLSDASTQSETASLVNFATYSFLGGLEPTTTNSGTLECVHHLALGALASAAAPTFFPRWIGALGCLFKGVSAINYTFANQGPSSQILHATKLISGQTQASGFLQRLAACGLNSGASVVVWRDGVSASGVVPQYTMFARMYNASGTQIGDDILLYGWKDITGSYSSGSEITFGQPIALNNGNFAVIYNIHATTFSSGTQTEDTCQLTTQVFDAQGKSLGSNYFLMEGKAYNYPFTAKTLSNGNIIVAWRGWDSSGNYLLQALLQDSTGATIGTSFQIAPSANNFYYYSILPLSNGAFMAMWSSTQGIYMHSFSSSGISLGSIVQIVAGVSGFAAGVVNDNLFVAYFSGANLCAQIFDAAGNSLSGELIISRVSGTINIDVSVTDSWVLVSWVNTSPSNSIGGMFGRLFDFNGNAISDEFQIVKSTDFAKYSYQTPGASAVPLSDKSLGVFWAALDQYNRQASLYRQQVSVLPLPFVNGSLTNLTYAQSPVVIDPAIVVQDVSDGQPSSATVTIANNLFPSQDKLGFSAQNGITGSYQSSLGLLSFTGSASADSYQTLLRSVTYTNSAANPNTKPRLINFAVTDQNGASNTFSRNIVFLPASTTVAGAPPVTNISTSSLATQVTVPAPVKETSLAPIKTVAVSGSVKPAKMTSSLPPVSSAPVIVPTTAAPLSSKTIAPLSSATPNSTKGVHQNPIVSRNASNRAQLNPWLYAAFAGGIILTLGEVLESARADGKETAALAQGRKIRKARRSSPKA